MTDTPESKPPVDWLYRLILSAICVVVVWLLLMPFVPGVARMSMERFHLRAPSFAIWAAQAPVPAMYNFANRYEIREIPEGLLMDFAFEKPEPRYANHFPARVITFGRARYTVLKDGSDRWATLWTSYRGQTVTTKLHLKPIGDGQFEWIRKESR